MPDPRTFEVRVAKVLEEEGYSTEVRGGPGDGGVDVLASRGKERLAVQVKMYGGTSRPVNRKMILELHGAAALFDCTGAILATDGRVLDEAREAAEKLAIRILFMKSELNAAPPRPAQPQDTPSFPEVEAALSFEVIWKKAIVPLAGRTILRAGLSNRIVSVDWSGVTRITSNGNSQRIDIEIFRWAITRVLERGEVTREEINGQYEGRASSGVALILAQVPEFEVSGRPITIRLRTERAQG